MQLRSTKDSLEDFQPGFIMDEDEAAGTVPARPLPRQPRRLRMVNGSSPLHGSISAQERDELEAEVRATHAVKRPVDLDAEEDDDEPETGDDKRLRISPTRASPRLRTRTSKPARDVRDTAPGNPSPITSRPASPYTRNPPVDFDGLSWPSIGTRDRKNASSEEALARQRKLEGAARTILECLGEDPDREGLRLTPERYAKAMLHFTKGYAENVRDLVNGAVFHEDHDELVMVKGIDVYSMCEHHMVPFMGKMAIGYIPNRRVLGLSKLARLAEMFARRLQVQERLTKQVALAIVDVLKPRGVAVVMESAHLCMVMRGVEKTSATTVTSCMLGCMRKSAKTRDEFLSLLKMQSLI